MFYTYLWLRYDGTTYYVGKGKDKRAYTNAKDRSVNCPREKSRIIIQEWPCEHDAFEAEKFLIAYYGRKDLGQGSLRNRTDGGDGPSGAIRSALTLEKLSKRMLGKKIRLGGTLTTKAKTVISSKIKELWQNPEYREHMVAAHVGQRLGFRKTHCIRGHELSDENVRVAKSGIRNCLPCEKIRGKNRRNHMAFESKREPGKKFGNIYQQRKFDSYEAGPQPGEANDNEHAMPKEEGASAADIAAAHGPAHTVTYTHNHDEGKHSVTSHHDDGHTHTGWHDTAALAYEAGGELAATSPKKREHPDQQGAESEERNYENMETA